MLWLLASCLVENIVLGINSFFDKLAGTDELRKQIISGKTENEIKNSWKKGLSNFKKTKRKYLIYK